MPFQLVWIYYKHGESAIAQYDLESQVREVLLTHLSNIFDRSNGRIGPVLIDLLDTYDVDSSLDLLDIFRESGICLEDLSSMVIAASKEAMDNNRIENRIAYMFHGNIVGH